ncbi:MAG: DegQ family serine endoprotease [Nitrospinae bacterium]|nr:DegQ family serine endoprotease [Nitrospinota bacterium]
MTRKIRHTIYYTLIIVSLISIGAVMGAHFRDKVDPVGVIEASAQGDASLDPAANRFAKIARDLTPAVVNISSRQKAPDRGKRGQNPFEWYYPFPGPEMPGGQERQSLGSGFVVEADGYILTNNHVVEQSDEIIVTFGDGHNGDTEKEYEAKVIGADPKTDIALIKIEPGRKLPTVKLGDSDRLQVGEWVMAVGNPFGFSQSVTVGVVSAKGRFIGAGPYDDFIQTDASINPGNSGGPLANISGEVVGINSAIYTGGRSAGNIGIGFAVPVNLVKAIYADLKKGKIERGWLGVRIQPITGDLASALGLKSVEGALVALVMEGSPAEKAGFARGDVIVEFNGQPIPNSETLPRVVASVKPGVEVKVKVIRKGNTQIIALKLGVMPDEPDMEAAAPKPSEDLLGMTVETITPHLARRLELDRVKGVVVTGVAPYSPASRAGFRPGDVIIEVNQMEVASLEEFENQLAGVKPGQTALFVIQRGGNTQYMTLTVPEGE